VELLYVRFSESGLPYGPTFRLIEEALVSEDGVYVLSQLCVGADVMHESYVLSPALLDAVLQSTAGAALVMQPLGQPSGSLPQVPYAFDDVWVRPGLIASLWQESSCRVLVEVRSQDSGMSVFNVSLLNISGEVVLHLNGMYTRSIVSPTSSHGSVAPYQDVRGEWRAGAASDLIHPLPEVTFERCLLIGNSCTCSLVEAFLMDEECNSMVEVTNTSLSAWEAARGESQTYDVIILCGLDDELWEGDGYSEAGHEAGAVHVLEGGSPASCLRCLRCSTSRLPRMLSCVS
jgi:hypothetical protein